MEEELSFLGTGWSFPPTFDNRLGRVQMVSEEEDIRQSLQLLLATSQGERVLQPDFGCNLDRMQFEPITNPLIAYIRDLIETAILYHEPRVDLNSISVNASALNEGYVLIELDYTVRINNSRYNMVLPFYMEAFHPFFNNEPPKELQLSF